MSYYIFQSKITSWRNHEVQAKLRDYGKEVGRGKNRKYIEVPEPIPHWWDALPITAPIPHLVFTVHSKAPLPDNFFTGTIFDLYSERLVNVLKQANVQFETFPATLVDYKTNEEIPARYEVFHLLESRNVLDRERSSVNPRGVDKLVLLDELDEQLILFFRIGERANLVIIHQSLKDILEKQQISGCQYIPVHEYQTGYFRASMRKY